MRKFGRGKRAPRRASADASDDEDEPDADVVRQQGNTVFFHADVTKLSVAMLLKSLADASAAALHTPIAPRVYLYIHSAGGDVYAGLSAMDHIARSTIPVVTIADGFVASAATLMLLGGETRYGMPNSTVLIHQLSTGFWGKFVDLQDEVVNSTKLMATLRTVYKERTKLTKKKVMQVLLKELTINYEEAIEAGIFAELPRR